MPKDLSEIALGLSRILSRPSSTCFHISTFSSTFSLWHSHFRRYGRCIKSRQGLSNSSGVFKIHRQHTTRGAAFEQKLGGFLFNWKELMEWNKGEIKSVNDCDAHTVMVVPGLGSVHKNFVHVFPSTHLLPTVFSPSC